jgi:hypothetical protein
MGYLCANHLGLKDFAEHANQMSLQVKQASLAVMEQAHRPVRYLNSGKESKQEIAQKIAVEAQIHCGPVCALTAVDLCRSYAIRGDRLTHQIRLERAWRKCLFVYQYWMHPVFGLMSARLQTWFPFPHPHLPQRASLAGATQASPTHRHRVSEQGRLILNAILTAHHLTTLQLAAAA